MSSHSLTFTFFFLWVKDGNESITEPYCYADAKRYCQNVIVGWIRQGQHDNSKCAEEDSEIKPLLLSSRHFQHEGLTIFEYLNLVSAVNFL